MPTNFDSLLYKFDAENRWAHRTNPPHESSVAKGARRHKVPKMKKIYERKKTTYLRKNAPFRDPRRIARSCCRKCCLNGISDEFIKKQRQMYFRSYKDINYGLLSLIRVTIRMSGRRQITYEIPSLGQVCKLAFKKCFAISCKKLEVLLRKQKNDSPLVEHDLRGRHKNNCRTIPSGARDKVISFIKSFKPEPSHYHRNRSNKKYFSAQYTMRAMWRCFNKKNPRFKATRLKSGNKGPPISLSCFRNIFCKYLSDEYSFRLPRTDTCQMCDQLIKKRNDFERTMQNQDISELTKLDAQAKLLDVRETLSKHLDEGELRYANFDYDINVLCAAVAQ